MTHAPLHHPFAVPPEAGTVTQVAAGILWIRMALPFALDHINLWALADGDGWTLIDTGIANDDTKAVWDSLFSGPLAGRPVTRLVCTHFHPDHMGLAGWLCERWSVTLVATQAEWLYGRMLCLEQEDDYQFNQREFYRLSGWNPEQLEALAWRGNTYRPRVGPIPTCFHRIAVGDELAIGGRLWRVMVGQGHAPEHASLYCAEANILISGDQVLPKISPIIGVWPQEHESNPLGLFLKTLPQFKDLPADCLVLPSHGLPFVGLHSRVDELMHHHHERLDRTLSGCAQPATALEVLKVLFKRELDAWQIGFATGETLAHLNYLWHAGRITREARADGVWLYRSK